MSISAVEIRMPEVSDVAVSDETLQVELSDGRSLSVPVGWYPRLAGATDEERSNWAIMDEGHGIHWRDLDEDVSLAGMLAGHPSRESQTSLKRWLRTRSEAGTGS